MSKTTLLCILSSEREEGTDGRAVVMSPTLLAVLMALTVLKVILTEETGGTIRKASFLVWNLVN